ncbi:phosphotransferase [Acetobacteraceae bacterium H6797]|nr:phosphotransferase [Acetobacteraceae bacterium H6797]
MSLDPAAEAFLAAHGFARAARHTLPGDAGHRRYTRLTGGPEPALLVDGRGASAVGLDGEADLRKFRDIRAHLAGGPARVPRLLAEDLPANFLLVEDLGPVTMAQRLDAGDEPLPLYLAAAEALAAIQKLPPPAFLPPWEGRLMGEIAGRTVLDWWWPAMFGSAPTPALREAFYDAVEAMVAPFLGAHCFVHRDFFPANLVPLPEGGLGVIDFQDAGIGHPAYDLVSLVEDARRPVPDAIREATIAHYLSLRPELDPEAFRAAMAAMGAQRHLRVATHWTRLARRDNKPAYLRFGPLCWSLLARSLGHPAAAPLATFLDAHIPPARRCNPPEDAAA